jgi:type III restriction enzyme
VYLRTIHDLYQSYGFKKFIIVVPSLAIKEGALKTCKSPKSILICCMKSLRWIFICTIRKSVGGPAFCHDQQPANSGDEYRPVCTGGNIIYQDSDWGIPIQYIQSVRPIVIVDEPQNMETENRKRAIDNLSPLCTLRYSATHKYHYNLVYRLDPVRAYDLGLVKKIEVDGIESEDAFNQAYIELKAVTSKKKTLTAKLRIDVAAKDGVVKKDVTVRAGQDLFVLSNRREIYKDGFIVDEIDASEQSVTFSNGTCLIVGQTQGGLNDAVM